MTEVARVAVLGSAGEARAHLRKALTEAGADIALEADPRETDLQALSEAHVSVILFSVDEQNEETLDQFQPVFDDPAVSVIFDEAAVTRHLGGWELARWARHLVSKLLGDQSMLLPPVPAEAGRVPASEVAIEPGAPQRPEDVMRGAELSEYTTEVPTMAASVPVNEMPRGDVAADLPMSFDELSNALDLNVDDIERALTAGLLEPEPEAEAAMPPSLPAAVPEVPEAGAGIDPELASAADADGPAAADDELAMSDLDLGEIDLSSLATDDATASSQAAPSAEDSAAGGDIDFAALDLEDDAGPVDFSRFAEGDADAAVDLDADLAALAASLDANMAAADEARPEADAGGFDFSLAESEDAEAPEASAIDEPRSAAPEPKPGPEAKPQSVGVGSSLFANLSLVGDDDASTAAPAAPAAPAEAPAAIDFDALISGLSLVDADGPVATTERGAVLVLAGAGGPDALRQVLSALPESLPVPVLIAQHLDNGNHDRLVPQLAKASRLPVALAAPNAAASGGRVHVLPPGVQVTASRHGGLEFSPGRSQQSDLLRALLSLAGDLTVVVASGTEAAVAGLLDECLAAGVDLIGQEPAACFDATVPERVAALGRGAGELGERVARALSRWSA